MAAKSFGRPHWSEVPWEKRSRIASQRLAEAKAIAMQLNLELATLGCSPVVLGTALAIIVGHIAAQLDAADGVGFYAALVLAARDSTLKGGDMLGGLLRMH
jgi:hypothetical protein